MEPRKMNDSTLNRLIEPFQKGETPTFIEHSKAGLKALAEDPRGVLIFSGGPTKKPRTSLSEGQSYLNLAKDNNYFQSRTLQIDPSRVIAETHATDSYQNVLFSLLRFRLYTGVYPHRVTIVTHEFKRARFMECHFPAVGLLPRADRKPLTDSKKICVVGINPPEEVTPLETLIQGETSRGIGLWRRDLYGVDEELSGKRAKRGWLSGMEKVILVDSKLEDAVEQLVRWDAGAGNEWFPMMEALPWYHGKD
ncbi:uncharacterized protein N7459_000243, partial [Penicillium hispanicum]|uniref:uncharacterized protein n=1 Tax=Penicillium hispanicum TaxID=1080232 RepID=UPI0025403D58